MFHDKLKICHFSPEFIHVMIAFSSKLVFFTSVRSTSSFACFARSATSPSFAYVSNPVPDSSLCRAAAASASSCCSSIASICFVTAVPLACVRFGYSSPISTAPRLRALRLLLPDCVRFTCSGRFQPTPNVLERSLWSLRFEVRRSCITSLVPPHEHPTSVTHTHTHKHTLKSINTKMHWSNVMRRRKTNTKMFYLVKHLLEVILRVAPGGHCVAEEHEVLEHASGVHRDHGTDATEGRVLFLVVADVAQGVAPHADELGQKGGDLLRTHQPKPPDCYCSVL